jgi:hypothetical protein
MGISVLEEYLQARGEDANSIVTYLGVWLQTGYGLVNGFIDHLYTPLGATSNYSATANLQNSQFTTATAFNSGDSSSSCPHVVTVRQISRNWTLVNCQLNNSTISSQPPLKRSLNCQPSANWVPGWWPFHTNLLVSSSQADFHLRTDNWTLPFINQLLQFTSLNWNAFSWPGILAI